MNDGSNQDERLPPGLADIHTLVDDRDLAAVLAATREHAAALAFRDANGALDGTWATLLDSDESFLIARSAALRIDTIERAFLDDHAAGRRAGMERKLARLADWLAGWREGFAALASPGGRDLGAQLDLQLRQIVGDPRSLRQPPGPRANADDLRARFFQLVEAVRGQQRLAQRQLAPSLASGDHDPAAALLLAAAQVHGRIQARLNGFPARLVDFYYHDCLQLAPNGAEPDRVHLVVRRDPFFAAPVVIAAGQPFAATMADGGDAIVFTADTALAVGDAEVAMLRSIRCERDLQTAPESSFDQITSVAVAELDANVGSGGGPTRPTVAVLGGEVPGCELRGQPARMGIAIASPILWLAQGEREICVALSMRCRDVAAIDRALGAVRDQRGFAQALGLLLINWLFSDAIDDATMVQLAGRVCALRRDDGTPYFDARTIAPPDANPAQPDRSGAGPDAAFRDPDDLLALLLGNGKRWAGDRHPIDLASRRRLARDALFPSFFKVELSCAAGWFAIDDPIPLAEPGRHFDGLDPRNAGTRAGAGAGSVPGVMALKLVLKHGDPPIVAPTVGSGDWPVPVPVPVPVLRLTVADQPRLYPLSLFEDVVLESVALAVDVTGLRDLDLHNQLGRLDASKPFAPFGPMPARGAYLVIGSPELAAKQLTRYCVDLEWTGLPPGGFADHYRFYPSRFSDTDFTVQPALLRDGVWVAAGAAQLPMFRAPVGVAAPDQRVALAPAALVSNWRVSNRHPTADPTRFDQNARNGFAKLTVTGPEQGFGEAEYAGAIAEAMRAPPNGRRDGGLLRRERGAAMAVPQPPFMPRLAGLTVAYAAATTLRVGSDAGDERIFHVHPFGMRTIHPAAAAAPLPTVLAHCGHDGQLLIGLRAAALHGPLTLFFEMRPDTAIISRAEVAERTPLAWSYLAADVWLPLEQRRVISDTTRGFLRSGIVSLVLPAGLTRDNSVLPGGLFWLRVGSNDVSKRFAGLRGVEAQVLRATRQRDGAIAGPLPAGRITLKSASIPGLLGLHQPEPGLGLRRAEDANRERTRIGERLRHKDRAVTAWDYERLVLEAFPQVFKVKCLANLSARTRPAPADAPETPLLVRPGHVLVVVVPDLPAGRRGDLAYSTRPLQIDAWEMERIRLFLLDRTPPGVRLEVINVAYEHLQVRCEVALDWSAQTGTVLARINEAIVRFLSPWCDEGLRTRFDWAIRTDDLYAAIRAADSKITAISGVSLIRVWEDDRLAATDPNRMVTSYHLHDSVRAAAPGGTPATSTPGGTPATSTPGGTPATSTPIDVRAQRPWTLPIPFARHIIELAGTGSAPGNVMPTGIARVESAFADAVAGLQIGETFIIDARSSQGETP